MNTVPMQSLRRYNLIAGIVHLGQAVAIAVLANGFSLPIDARYMSGPPGGGQALQHVFLGHLSTAAVVIAFFLLSAIAHLAIAGPLWDRYCGQLTLERNPFRWIEYSVSSSLMILLIAQITGISDAAGLVALVGVNASMTGFGWLQERYESPGGGMAPFWMGCAAGIVPWIAIGIYLIAPGAHSHAPGFVYGIFISLFAFFNIFGLTQWLQYRKVGKWADYLVGERTYITLSLVAKSLLAWQIFASTLAPTN